jgi:hypothetical protein
MAKYDKDTTAEALMLFDNGNSRFILNSDRVFQYVYDRHCRIKIFKKSAFQIANISIKLFDYGLKKEKLNTLNAPIIWLMEKS